MFPYIIDKTPLGRDAFPVEFEPRNGLTSVLINNIRVTQRDLVFQTKFLNYKCLGIMINHHRAGLSSCGM